jgi:hypothetical protein
MKRLEHIAYIGLVVLLLVFLAVFPLLTFDAVGKLLRRAAALQPGNFLLVLYLELSRAFTTIIALLATISLLARSSRDADGRALALFFIFVALTYEKIFGTTGYPGPLQEKFTVAMLDAGISRATLTWLFGPVPWTLWLALAAALRFSVVFPHPPLSAAAIDASGQHDRRGMLRGAGIAGLDIGAAFRGVAKKGLTLGAFRPVPLWLTALVLVAVTSLTTSTTRIVLFVVAASLVGALAITNLRASYSVVVETEKRRMRWLILGFAAGAAIFMIAALPLLFFDNTVANVPALVLLMVAPAVIMICMAVAVLYSGSIDAERLLHRLPGLAALMFSLLLVFALSTTALTRVTQGMGVSSTLAVLGAVVLTAVALDPLRRFTGRAVARVLERPERYNG